MLLYSTGVEALIYTEKSELICKISSPIAYDNKLYDIKLFKTLNVNGDIVSFSFSFENYDYYGEVSINDMKVMKIEICK